MNALEAALRGIARELDARGRRWALVGGLAVSARAEPRTTRDVDVAVATDGDADAEALVFALQGAGFRVVGAVEQDAAGRLATVRLRPGSEGRLRGVVVDLLFASSGVEAEVADAAERLEVLAGVTVPVARKGHLVALKVLARDDRSRPRDAEDLRGLLAESGPEDLVLARKALRLVASRGFARGKDLEAELERAVRDLGR